MQIQDLNVFLEYREKVHQRTTRVARCIPPDKVEWSYQEGKFAMGDPLRHIATIERYMFAETVAGRPSRYEGCCGKELADGCDQGSHFVTSCMLNRSRSFPGLLPNSSGANA